MNSLKSNFVWMKINANMFLYVADICLCTLTYFIKSLNAKHKLQNTGLKLSVCNYNNFSISYTTNCLGFKPYFKNYPTHGFYSKCFFVVYMIKIEIIYLILYSLIIPNEKVTYIFKNYTANSCT